MAQSAQDNITYTPDQLKKILHEGVLEDVEIIRAHLRKQNTQTIKESFHV